MDKEAEFYEMSRRMKNAVEVILGMSIEECFKLVDMEIDKIGLRLDALEALEAQPESVAADVQPQEAAPTQIELGRSAGREPCSLEGFERFMDEVLADLSEVDDELEYCDVASGWDFVASVKRCIGHYRSTAAKSG